MCTGCTRRDFLGTTAMTSLLLAAHQASATARVTGEPSASGPRKNRIAVIFAGKPTPPDRNWGVCEEEITAITQRLAKMETRLGDVEFVIGRAVEPEHAIELMKQAGDEAPVLVVNLCIGGLLRVAPPILESGRPLAVYAPPASGHDWMYPFRWRQEGKRVTLFASSDDGELERAARLLRVIPMLRKTRVIVLPPLRGTPPACSPEKVKSLLGVDLIVVSEERLDAVLNGVTPSDVRAETEQWLGGAKRIIEPTYQDVEKAARVSLALQRLVEEEHAQGLAIGSCMRWLSRGFPCLGFTRLRDRGIPASCEGDMDSLWTMQIFGYVLGIPGFQGNATFDTANNALWTAHCVGPLKMDGPDGPTAPYLLRSHSEIGAGVVPEIQYRIGQEVTRAKLVNLDTLLISTGTICEVPEKSERGCRTQIVTKVHDAANMIRNWGGGVLEGDMMTLLHRVVFYGDHIKTARHLADLMNLRIVEEG